jgi:hypothetical protein
VGSNRSTVLVFQEGAVGRDDGLVRLEEKDLFVPESVGGEEIDYSSAIRRRIEGNAKATGVAEAALSNVWSLRTG